MFWPYLYFVEAGKVEYASLSDGEWMKRLTREQFYVTRQKGTEGAFTGYLWYLISPLRRHDFGPTIF